MYDKLPNLFATECLKMPPKLAKIRLRLGLRPRPRLGNQGRLPPEAMTPTLPDVIPLPSFPALLPHPSLPFPFVRVVRGSSPEKFGNFYLAVREF